LCPVSPDFREGGSEQIREGAQKSDKTSQNSKNVEEFLAGLRDEMIHIIQPVSRRNDCLPPITESLSSLFRLRYNTVDNEI